MSKRHIRVIQSDFSHYSFRMPEGRVQAFNYQGFRIDGGVSLFDIHVTANHVDDCFVGWVLMQAIDFVQLTWKEHEWSKFLSNTSYPHGSHSFCYRCDKLFNGFRTCPSCALDRAARIESLAKVLTIRRNEC